MRRTLAAAALSALAGLAAPLAAGPSDDRDPAVRHAAKAAALIDAKDAAALGRRLALVKADPALDERAREKLLRSALLGLADMKTDADTRRLAAAYRNYPSTTIIWHEEHGHPEPVLLYDVAAAARFAERRWAESDARDAALAALAAGEPLPADSYDGDEAARRGVAEAYATAPKATLSNQRDALLAALVSGRPVGDAALVTAERLEDAGLYEALLEHGDGPTALAAVRRLDAEPGSLDPVPLLALAATRADAASAALIALGRRASTDPDAATLLFDQLGSAHGASAAAALARSADDDVVERLADILSSHPDERARRHALLGLRLADGERARARLRDFARDDRQPVALRQEVPAWLRD